MTAVAAPVQLQSPSGTGWSSVNGTQNGLVNMSQEEVGRMFIPGPRKQAQRSNSSSSISSLSSVSTTGSTSSTATTGTTNTTDTWESRKKAARGLWPPGKAAPTSGISTARPQFVPAAPSGATAASGLSALHAPILVTPQMANGHAQQNAPTRTPPPNEASAFLYLLPMNGTFERKTINVPYYPDVLRIGRQTNAKTAPTASNGFFDSKVLSRQHAELYAEGNGRVFIRDVKSSNGTFVNGKRLSPENKESEPQELREQDVLELGIDIVSEDQKTVVHHKVAARVEHAGMYSQSGEIGLDDLDPANAGFVGNQSRQRVGHMAMPGIKGGSQVNVPGPVPNAAQQQWPRMWMQPVSTENIVKRLNRELNMARLQSQDMNRLRVNIASLLDGKGPTSPLDEDKAQSPVENMSLSMTGFPQPPAPPPSQPLPEKPDATRLLEDPIIQPILQRSSTAKPTISDSSDALFALSHELKAAKSQIPDLQSRVQLLEQQLKEERTLRAKAEQRVEHLEHASRQNSVEPSSVETHATPPVIDNAQLDTLQANLDRLHASMAEMKSQMESYRRRAEAAESQRDQARVSLAEMIEEKRARLATAESLAVSVNSDERQPPPSPNGHTIRPGKAVPLAQLLEKAGLPAAGEKPLTRAQAAKLVGVVKRELLVDDMETAAAVHSKEGGLVALDSGTLMYHGIPHAAALTTVLVGLAVMSWLNGWEKMKA